FRVVPVADMNRCMIAGRPGQEGAQKARERTFLRPRPFRVAEEAPALRASDVQLIRQRRSSADRRHELVLQTFAEEQIAHAAMMCSSRNDGQPQMMEWFWSEKDTNPLTDEEDRGWPPTSSPTPRRRWASTARPRT